MNLATNFGDECAQDEKRLDNYVSTRLLKQRTVLLAGTITQEAAQRLISQLLLLSEESSDEPIRMFVNSPGGDADAGFAIFDIIRYVKAPVHMITAGLAASAAVIVLLASPRKLRFSLPNARFLIHQPSTGVQGAAADIQIEASEILKFRERINLMMSEETGRTLEQINEDTRRNFWMDAKEALDYGLVGKIVAKQEG